jgi:23S rRNA (adenine2503-C2)-methyltransferase
MGEPSLNPAVLNVLKELPERYPVRGLMPCIATVAPKGSEEWFEKLAAIKDEHFNNGRFQLQFSLNSTDEDERDRFMPVKKWGLKETARYGEEFYKDGDRKVTLNFALAKKAIFETGTIKEIFDPEKFLIKITPVNPTGLAGENGFKTVLSPELPRAADNLTSELDKAGFETIISIGAPEEISIGSNCGQTVRRIYGYNNKGSIKGPECDQRRI